MKLKVHIQRPAKLSNTPSNQSIRKWVRAALQSRVPGNELTIRLVGTREGTRLNRKWRGKNTATNVLSFPASVRRGPVAGFLGDIILCAPVIAREAAQQEKSLNAHWAHMIIHGVLHLLGYDHTRPKAARKMESLEKKLLAGLSIADPYT